MKKISTLTAFVSLAALIALSVVTPTNHSPGKTVIEGITIQADGSPMPPFPPHSAVGEVTLAGDGSPMPPMPPHLLTGASVV